MLRHERVIAEAAESFNSSAQFRENLHSMLGKLGDALALDSITIWEIDNRGGIARFFHNWKKDAKLKCMTNHDFHRRDLPAFFDRIVRGEPVVVLPDSNRDGLEGFFKHCGKCLSLSSPLAVAGKVKGMIDFRKHGDYAWTDEEAKLLRAISEIITNAWERYNEIQARLAAERRQTESVQMVERATRLASIGVIAAGITHEINQPLNAIRLTADGSLMWLERNEVQLPEKFTERLRKISSHVERITRIIKHMRQFWAPREGSDTEVFDLHDAVNDAVGLIDQQLAAHGINLVKTYAGEPIPISGDRLHLEQIVINLTVNAMQILDANKRSDARIEIRTSVSGDEGVLEVEDNGPGLHVEDIDKIFEMFYTTRKPGEGSGLGLAIVKRYSEELGGRVAARNSESSGGALFTVALPLAGEWVPKT
jgi:signal transduction histidine kinase